MPDEFTPEQKRQAVRVMREHYQAHGGVDGCLKCEVWQAYTARDSATLDALVKRIETDDEFEAIVKKLRADWGEGTWTDRESE